MRDCGRCGMRARTVVDLLQGNDTVRWEALLGVLV
jgi:hypothetical protein